MRRALSDTPPACRKAAPPDGIPRSSASARRPGRFPRTFPFPWAPGRDRISDARHNDTCLPPGKTQWCLPALFRSGSHPLTLHRISRCPAGSPPVPALPVSGRLSWKSAGSGPGQIRASSWAGRRTARSPWHGYGRTGHHSILPPCQSRKTHRTEKNAASRCGPGHTPTPGIIPEGSPADHGSPVPGWAFRLNGYFRWLPASVRSPLPLPARAGGSGCVPSVPGHISYRSS